MKIFRLKKLADQRQGRVAAWVAASMVITQLTGFAAPAWADNWDNGNGNGSFTPVEVTPGTPPEQTPPPVTPTDTSGAYAAGIEAGRRQGQIDGETRGSQEGRSAGEHEGYRSGFDRCEREERERQYDRGYRSGYSEGESNGRREGYDRGDRDGRVAGENEGRADGTNRADRDAYNAATPLGRQRGIEQANNSDATERGRADGTRAGDQQALQRAIDVDYPRGRKKYSDDQWASPIANQDEFSQRQDSKLNKANRNHLLQSLQSTRSAESDAERIDQLIGALNDFGTPEEQEAFQRGYHEGYNSAYHSAYRSAYDRDYRATYDRHAIRGCQDARARDYRDSYNRGYNEGQRRGYNDGYQPAYDSARRRAYDSVFPGASENAYRQTYQGFYNQHFETARASAYQQRVGELYDAAYEDARNRKFNEMYPTYAEQQYQRGLRDEAEDFKQRPVRLTDAEAEETIVNGLYEPNETLRIRFKLRNFAAEGLDAKDIKVTLTAENTGGAIVSEGDSLLAKGLRSKSVTLVKNALEFRIQETVADRAQRFFVNVLYKGRNVGQQIVTVLPQFQVKIEFAEAPQLREGISSPIKVKLTNRSRVATDPSLRVRLMTDAAKFELEQSELNVGSIASGESRVIEFNGILRGAESSVNLPLVFSATGDASRRVGLMDLSGQVPVINDYRVKLTHSIDALRAPGVVRANYVVKNVSSRLLFRGLQLKVRVTGTAKPENFVVIGPNPQFLMPLEQGQSAQFVVPILVKEANDGGTLELELQEAGSTVVIHQAPFKQGLN